VNVRNSLKVWTSLILAFSTIQANQIVQITLTSNEVIAKGTLEKLSEDTLYFTALSDQNQKRQIPINEIISLISLQESTPVKYIFSSLSLNQKMEIVNNLIDPAIVTDFTKRSQIFETSADRPLQITIIIGVLIVLVTAIGLLLKFKRKPQIQEGIPGVEEMAKTTFFWAEWHREKNEED